jgi:hypothetical protein
MPEPDRFESLASPDADRDSRAELLLIDGLDQYFAGNYHDAIHIWTRVLFLDRTHTRARAYIDRARTALAERQRRTDELLESSYQLLGEGRSSAARELLDKAVAETGEDERVSALRVRLERIERFERLAAASSRRAASPVSTTSPTPDAGTRARRVSPVALWLMAATAGIIAVAVAGRELVPEWLGLRETSVDLSVYRPAPELAPLSTSDVALIRARNAFNRGKLAEALQALSRVAPDSPVHLEADALRVRIQQSLIASASSGSRTEVRRP